jgi:hypothetical protein
MAGQMVCIPSSPFDPRPGQVFTVGSFTWVINDNGDEEIVPPV